jgi:hypothetical protein
MKIRIVKKPANHKPSGFCVDFVDGPPVDKR